MNMIQRVAARYMSASHLEAPPAMVKAILEGVTDLYVNRALAFISKPREPRGIPQPLVAYRDNPSLETLSALQSFFTRGMRDQWLRIDDPKSPKAKKLLKTTWDAAVESLAESKHTFEQQSRVYREALSLLSSPPQPEYYGDVEQDFWLKFPLDLSGWKYQSKVSTPTVKFVTVQSSGLSDGAGASWDRKNWILRLPVLSSATLKDWNSLRNWLVNTLPNHVYHECQHMSQAILEDSLKSKTLGLPGKKQQTPQWNQHTRSTDLRVSPGDEYFLDDTEFHTTITTAIHRTRAALKQNPDVNARDLVAGLVKGLVPRIGGLDNVHQFFKVLRQHAPAKYRKAVGEFVKAIL